MLPITIAERQLARPALSGGGQPMRVRLGIQSTPSAKRTLRAFGRRSRAKRARRIIIESAAIALVAVLAPIVTSQSPTASAVVEPLSSEAPSKTVPEVGDAQAQRPYVASASPQLSDAKVEEVVAKRDANSRVFRAADGSLILDAYSEPIHYLTDRGWQPIDNRVRPDDSRPGWLRTNGNAWKVSFGPSTVRVEAGDSDITMSPDDTKGARAPRARDSIRGSQSPSTAADVRANRFVPASDVVEYPDVWDGAALRYEVRGSGLKEEVIVRDSTARANYPFVVSGAKVSLRPDGGLTLRSGRPNDEFFVPAPVVLGANGSDLSEVSRVRFDLGETSSDGTQRVVLSVDPSWLSQQKRDVFPLRVDPTLTLVSPQFVASYATNGNSLTTGTAVLVGNNSATGVTWRGGVAFQHYQAFLVGGYRVYNALLQFAGHGDADPALQVYDQGAQPTTFGSIGTGKSLVDGPWDGPFVNVTKTMDRWVTQQLTGQWFGVRGTETGSTLVSHEVRLVLAVYVPPPSTLVTSIPLQTPPPVYATTTPLLEAGSVDFAQDGTRPSVEFQITTSPAPSSGLVLSSGMIEQVTDGVGVQWRVPQGTLQQGLTYWAWALTDYPQYGSSVPPTVPPVASGRPFIINLGLGSGGSSPTDQVGSIPGRANSLSEGAPSPETPRSNVTVNMIDGNLAAAVGTKAVGALAGPIALQFTYNSLAPSSQGLTAEFFDDSNNSGGIDASDVKVGQRVDPTVSFDWGTGILAKAVAAQNPAKALARWTGQLNLPAAANPANTSWQLGAISSDGLRATLNGTVRLDRWATHEPEPAPVYGSTFATTPGSPLPISIEWRNTSGAGVARVFVKDLSIPSSPKQYALSPTWLTRTPETMPSGWLLSTAAGAARWVGLQDHGTSVTMIAADGSAHEFVAKTGGAYAPPTTAPGDLLTTGDSGRFVLRDAAGFTYTFRSDGTLESMASASDDRNPAAVAYSYGGSPVRLRTITDPVSGRVVSLSYAGDAACGSTPAAAAGLLCQIAYWDATTTTLTYDSNGRFIRLTNPGGVVYDFSYDSSNRLTDIRDPLANDAIAAGIRLDDATARTQIQYMNPAPDSAVGRVFRVIQPAPTTGATRPFRTYLYDTDNRIGSMYIDGITPTVGFAHRSRYDSRNRIIESTGADGLSSTYVWDASDRLVSTTTADSVRTTNAFDYASRPIATYGPAPASSFQANGLPNVGAVVPTITRVFDGGINALAAAYWSNAFLAGGPTLHDTGLGTGGSLDRDWGTTPPVAPGATGWSARLTGFLNVPSSGNYLFRVTKKGSLARVWIDDVLVVEDTQAEPVTGTTTATGAATTLSAGQHRVRVDMVDTSGAAALTVLWAPQSTLAYSVIPGTALSPGYGLLTSMTDPDGKTVATSYTDTATGIGPHYGLVTSTTSDPAGLALTTRTTYETPGAGRFFRRLGRTLPAGNQWAYVNYSGTEGPIAAVCGVSAATPQAGALKRTTGPDPDGAGPLSASVEEFVYDTVGRTVGRRKATVATLASAGWRCTTYDIRSRITSRTDPTHDGFAARTTTFTYAVGGNPLVNRVTDSNWASSFVTATVDLLGRPTSYTDVWGNITTTAYDQAGRLITTTGPVTVTQEYDAATGRPTVQKNSSGAVLSTPTYDAFGRLSSVVYGNGTGTAYTYNSSGNTVSAVVYDNQGPTGDLVTRSLAGRVIDQSVFNGSTFVDADPGANYAYDGAGRLTQASLPGTKYAYGYGTSAACPATTAGSNTNRTNVVVTGAGAGTTGFCYNSADQLVSTSSITSGNITYDDHGNTRALGSDTYDFDSSDRHSRTESTGFVTSYRRDPLDRLAERTDSTKISHVATTTSTGLTGAVTVNRPAGTQAGDLMVASVAAGQALGAGGIAASGWTLSANSVNAVGATRILWRYATASDPATWTFTVPVSVTIAGAISTYRNAAVAAPVSASATSTALLATSHPLPQVQVAADAQQLVHVVGTFALAAISAPSGDVQRAAVSGVTSLLVADRFQSRPGTSAAVSATSSLAVTSASATVALAPKTSVARYGYSGHTDSSSFTRDTSGALLDLTVPLTGNTALVFTPAGFQYAHSNLHGDVVTLTDVSGNRVSTNFSGPYGEATGGTDPVDTNVSGTNLRWHGMQQRITDRGIVQMGARPYSTLTGRFLSVDPKEGGCANDYAYVYGDPVNTSDVSGTNWLWDNTLGKIFTCDDTAAAKLLEALSYVPDMDITNESTVYFNPGNYRNGAPPTVGGKFGVKVEILPGGVATLTLIGSGFLVSKAAKGTLFKMSEKAAEKFLAHAALVSKISVGMSFVSVTATAYVAARWILC